MRLVLPALFLAGLAASCSEPAGQYGVPKSIAYAKLLSATFGEFRNERQCGVLIQVAPTGEAESAITWRVTSGGKEMFWFKASLTAIDAKRTKVDIEVGPKEANGREAYDGSLSYARPAVAQPVRPAIEEQIGAILEGRYYNEHKLYDVRLKDKPCLVQRTTRQASKPLNVNDADLPNSVRALPQAK